ncbi:hypothetical protein NC653_012478 [Populus alba x Populus x berolinensis]|uniref:Uncharacterized protein n=1 Tax=Populus alba x Populus x berolinensis TaxID=444605 RepID=A0AAD6QSI3_9ROSI|nr:hypothetical protein NC653_012478 [Populus alba x Populus x berolinensis]
MHGSYVRLEAGGAGGLPFGSSVQSFFSSLHSLCMTLHDAHWMVSFPFFCESLRFLSTWGVPLGGLALQSLWLQPLSVMILMLLLLCVAPCVSSFPFACRR